MEELRLGVGFHCGKCGGNQYRESYCLNAACGAYRRSADEHQEQGGDGRSVCQVFLRDGRKAGGSRGHGLKQRCLQFVKNRKTAHRKRIVIFKDKNSRRSGKDKDPSDGEGNFAVKGQIGKTSEALPPYIFQGAHKIPPDNVADPAENDQQDCHHIDNGIMDIGVQAVCRDYVHARVAESGHGVKQGNPDAFYAKFRDKYRHVQKRADSFDQKRTGNHFSDKLNHAGQGIQIEGVLNEHSVLDTDSAVQADHKPGHDSDDSKPADLDEKENDNLPKQAPRRKGWNGHKTRHTDGCGCRKERIYIRYGNAVCGADRQDKQRASQKNCQQKTEQDCLRCG